MGLIHPELKEPIECLKIDFLKYIKEKIVLTLKLLIVRKTVLKKNVFLGIPQDGSFNVKSNPGSQEAESLYHVPKIHTMIVIFLLKREKRL